MVLAANNRKVESINPLPESTESAESEYASFFTQSLDLLLTPAIARCDPSSATLLLGIGIGRRTGRGIHQRLPGTKQHRSDQAQHPKGFDRGSRNLESPLP